MNNSFVKEILGLLQTEQVKNELKDISKLVMDFILTKLNPYMYIIITIIVIIFLINVINIVLIILLYRKQNKLYFDTK